MELVQGYNQFMANQMGEVVSTIKTEYGVNIDGLKLEVSFVPPYLDEFRDEWEAFMCTVEDKNINMQFFYIVDTNTKKIVEVQMIDLDSKYVA